MQSEQVLDILSANNLELILDLLNQTIRKPKLLSRAILDACDEYLQLNKPEIVWGTPFINVQSEVALSCLTSILIINSYHSESPKKVLAYIKNWFQEFSPTDFSILNLTTADTLINLLDKIKAKKILEYNNQGLPIRTFFLPYRLGSFNSEYHPHLNFVLVGGVDSETGSNPEYVYLHELGHAFHNKISGSMNLIPETFIPIFEATFHNSFDKVSPADAPEVFADSFAVAVAYNTPFSKYVPFCSIFRDVDQHILSEYFKMVCESPIESLDRKKFWTKARKDTLYEILGKE